MDIIVGAVWILIEILCFYMLCDALLSKQEGNRFITIIIPVVWLVVSFYSCLEISSGIKQILSFLIYFSLSLWFYKGSILRHILVVVLFYILLGIFDTALLYGTSFILGISLDDFAWRKLLYVATVSASKLLTLYVAWMIRKARKTTGMQKIQTKWLLLTLLFPTVSFLMMEVIFFTYRDRPDLSAGAFIFSCVLSVANISILYLIHAMEKSTKETQELALLNQRMEIQTENIIALEKSYRTQRQATHEFKNQMQTIYSLLETEQIQHAKEYVLQLQGMQNNRILSVNSGHPIIDAVLNQKYQRAKEENIEVQIQVNNLSDVQISTNALVVLLANLLDNAIEACMRINTNREIHCSIIKDNSLYISIRNTSLAVSVTEDIIPTSKFPIQEHGYGIPSVRRILDQFNAEYTFDYENGWFQFAAEMPLEHN